METQLLANPFEVGGIEPHGAQAPQWFVLRTRHRHEQALIKLMDAQGVWCFNPRHRVVRTYQHRKVRRLLPMFPGYLFLHGHLETVYMADRSPHAAGFLTVLDQARLHDELCQIHRVVTEQASCVTPHAWIEHGVRVRVSGGVFEGVHGVVDGSIRRPDRVLVLQVGVLGQGSGLEINPALLEPVGDEVFA